MPPADRSSVNDASANAAALPLVGVRVIDLTTNMSGPLATMTLADQGADVVKVEPLTGDIIRTVGTRRGDMSAYFANLNRAKRSIAVDLATETGRDVVVGLATGADVFVQSFRTGVIDRLGLGADVLMAANPSLVYASISGYGPDGPLAGAPAYDHVIQAMSGFAALQAGRGEPDMVRQGVIDKTTSYAAAQAITAALLARTRTGRGTRLDLSMLDVAVAFLWPDGMMNHTADEPDQVLPAVSRSFRLTPTADGHVSLVTLTSAQWEHLVEAILADTDDASVSPGTGRGSGRHDRQISAQFGEGGSGAGGDQPDRTDTGTRMATGGSVMRRVRSRVAELSTDEVVARLSAADVPCARVVELDDLATEEQVRASGTVAAFDHANLGPVHQARPAARFDGEPSPLQPWAPELGEHTDEVLVEAGYDKAGIAQLRTEGIIA